MKFILGKKIGMSQIFRDNGEAVPVTVVEAGPCPVTLVRSHEKNGYEAIQIGFGMKKKQTRPTQGQLKDLPAVRYRREFRLATPGEYKRGDTIKAEQFNPGDVVKVTGISMGKGFQGVVKRHGFHGGPASHGHKDNLRAPGSIGAGGIQRVLKGTRMAGRMGNDQITVRNLEVVEVCPEENLILIKGAVPGARNALLKIQTLKEAPIENTKA
ncbi:MAG: 50S ribosomal protein L3 [Patescibacteria group bacterium]